MATPTLPDLKAFLGIDTDGQDAELTKHLGAARATMRHRCGPDIPTEVVERVIVRSGTAVLNELPLISVTSAVDDDGDPLDVSGAKLDNAGIVREIGSGGAFCGRAQLTVQAGHDPCPDDLELAIYVVAGHLWDTQRGRSGSFAQVHGLDDDAPVGGDASYLVLRGFALPRRAMELARAYLKPKV